jgi:hypothetical protein
MVDNEEVSSDDGWEKVEVRRPVVQHVKDSP